jgi:hypothetical protein
MLGTLQARRVGEPGELDHPVRLGGVRRDEDAELQLMPVVTRHDEASMASTDRIKARTRARSTTAAARS